MTQILLTNDDGILSPGLWAAARALSALGFVHVIAPDQQSSGTGRSLPNTSTGIIQQKEVQVNGQSWQVYAVNGTPAQAVLHALLEIMPSPPDLVVSGINYGENVGSGITVSGTVGAAMEAASHCCPALAVSLETDTEHHLSYSEQIDFSAAAHFTALFARLVIERRMPPDVDLLKIDVPRSATPQTPWEITRLSRLRYFIPVRPDRQRLDLPGPVGYTTGADPGQDQPDTDVYAIRIKRVVSVTPLSLDFTSRVDPQTLDQVLRF